MDKIEAEIEVAGEERTLRIGDGGSAIRISLTSDDQNEVMAAFNRLLTRLRDGEFRIELASEGDDLFFFVAKEYLEQLNREISEVFQEMERRGFTSG